MTTDIATPVESVTASIPKPPPVLSADAVAAARQAAADQRARERRHEDRRRPTGARR